MNKSLIKFFADFGPLLIFFIIYKKSGNDLAVSIVPLIVATLVSVIAIYLIEKKIPYVPLVGAIIISLFGGLTLYFSNPIFIYLKPTIVNIIFAALLLMGKKFFNKNFLQMMLKQAIQMNEDGWNKLNTRWGFFFIFLAILNEMVWRTQSEEIWVNFKVWGIIPLTFLFTLGQVPLINKHKE